jgi:hypothetical protein
MVMVVVVVVMMMVFVRLFWDIYLNVIIAHGTCFSFLNLVTAVVGHRE